MAKMTRQLQLYDLLRDVPDMDHIEYGRLIGPTEIINGWRISLRMLQRDLKDLRDSGLINIKYNKSMDRYIDAGNPVFDDTAGERRKQHLRRLYRLGTLITHLSKTPHSEIDAYECGIREFNEYVELTKEDPKEFPPEDIEMMREFYIPEPPAFYDLKAEYHSLFPNSNERTRQRDFKELSDAGFPIYYSREYKTYVFEEDDIN